MPNISTTTFFKFNRRNSDVLSGSRYKFAFSPIEYLNDLKNIDLAASYKETISSLDNEVFDGNSFSLIAHVANFSNVVSFENFEAIIALSLYDVVYA